MSVKYSDVERNRVIIEKMRKLPHISFPSFFILQVVSVVFIAADYRSLEHNVFMLCIASAIFILTYFTTLEIGLIFMVPFITGTVAYHAYEAIQTGNVNESAYFWLFWPILAMTALHRFTKDHKELYDENQDLSRKLSSYVTIDENTRLNNLLAFERDAKVYMGIARRYSMELVLILWRIRNQDQIKKQMEKKEFEQLVKRISEAVKDSLRREDLVYLVESEPYIIGTLIFAKESDFQAVTNHVSEKTGRIHTPGCPSQLVWELDFACHVYEGYLITPLAFLEECKRRLEVENYGEGE